MTQNKTSKTRYIGAVAAALALAGMATPAQAAPAGAIDNAEIKGAIGQVYNSTGGEARYGAAYTNEQITPGIVGGVSQSFEEGYFYWTPETGANFVDKDSAIGQTYLELGQRAVADHTLHPLGAPTTFEVCDGAALPGVDPTCVQSFAGGEIVENQNTGEITVNYF
ncbi:LGFP repeat-containing protein [Rothia aerolata]|uniref:Uncharacterized protein n=1 Tax=Rothia aerolata TaxID=1812262 RepID=A0A917IW16_9MICC|nr:hypothetical protein [Rothia aerolata]GGH65501.1 hypothetical protein GCM10007359_18800 [Rothia aerolata]